MESLSLGFILVRVQCPEVITVHVSKFISHVITFRFISKLLCCILMTVFDKKSLVFFGKMEGLPRPAFYFRALEKIRMGKFQQV